MGCAPDLQVVLPVPQHVVDDRCVGGDVQEHPVLPVHQAVHGQAAVVAQHPGQALQGRDSSWLLAAGTKKATKCLWGAGRALGRSARCCADHHGGTVPVGTHKGVKSGLLVLLEEHAWPGRPHQTGRAIVPVVLPAPLLRLLLLAT